MPEEDRRLMIRNRARIVAIWREVYGNTKGDLIAGDREWKFWEGLLAADPANMEGIDHDDN